jgi:hypothetical protein
VRANRRLSPVATLERWETFGGVWRSQPGVAGEVVVELCSCHGEVMERLRSRDRALLRYLADRPRSDPER